jgi:hypothetical protein
MTMTIKPTQTKKKKILKLSKKDLIVKKITYSEDPLYLRIDPPEYEEQRDRFLHDYGITLPSRDQFEKLGRLRRLWTQTNRQITKRVELQCGLVLIFTRYRGWTWDKASVPLFKGDRWLSIKAADDHDDGFTMHIFDMFENWDEVDDDGFRITNRLFLETMRYYARESKTAEYKRSRLPGYTKKEGRSIRRKARWQYRYDRFMSRVYYIAVKSIPGQSLYKNCNRKFWTEKTMRFEFEFSGN